jgi:hypothetical protein
LNNPSKKGISRRQDTPQNLQDDPQSFVLSRCSHRQDTCKIVPRKLEMQIEQAFRSWRTISPIWSERVKNMLGNVFTLNPVFGSAVFDTFFLVFLLKTWKIA